MNNTDTNIIDWNSRAQIELWCNSQVAKYWNILATDYAIDLPAPSITYNDNITGYAGFAYRQKHEVEYNVLYIYIARESFLEVIVHELVHRVVNIKYPKAKQAHGKEFKTIMQLAGFKGDTYHTWSKNHLYIARAKIQEFTMIDL